MNHAFFDLTDEEIEKEAHKILSEQRDEMERNINNILCEEMNDKQILEYAFNAAKAIYLIAPWLSASLTEDSCKEYADACEEIFKLELDVERSCEPTAF